MKKTKLQETLRERIKDNYFCGYDNNIWEPFENWGIDEIEKQIEIDVDTMTYFIEKNKDLIIDYLTQIPNKKEV